MVVSWAYADLKKNAFGAILIASLLALVPPAVTGWTNAAAPIQSVAAIGATIKSAQWGQGRINYVLLLDDGSSVLVDDDRLHVIGSHIGIERVSRENGFVFYRFPE
ncbi:hypothetical protein EN828_00080 [Mesorhizobium sp. M2D.F.Ca.ET.185.01.1.1]|uniref:hypothetical protein n=1 Tax=unclassified Mesorhizobium TaxID=325217 RepID=UPI000FCA9C70|nr:MULTISPECIES: hypothetical protein [unclassified Mesorhizobium]TGP83051.1 hypothetical protein EN870_00380 [bacterium M00.F.Ca.ET.227.01.1.1]TGP99008.1 hypothetical protein EN864_04280 [bacterium M00.F.Ca.ET.221.01.1.1]TGP99738.1 hypothetical protein EN865_04280 [bacterium M00.F.Ca.ET.222.01.1.1]TGU05501.1 hypothetical protein EN806_36450 [bacterium M00.F.Ca.ET.163.01.1.1]TGU25293.1 hypothetical protein EN799_45365 [bacterium M00.F.Ca.ET.156.01.1.1]TGU51067.1 hypothetical protein EN789_000